MTVAAAATGQARAQTMVMVIAPPLGQAGEVDPPGIGGAVGDVFFDQRDDEADIVGARGRARPGAFVAGPQIGPGAIEAVGKTARRIGSRWATFGHEVRAAMVGAGLGIAVQTNHQRRRLVAGQLRDVACGRRR